MAKPAKMRATAQALYEAGYSFSQIADQLPVSDRSVKEWCRKGKWVKGKSSQELHQKEQAKLVKEAEDAGIDRARILKELALIGFADMADFVTVEEGGGIRAIPFDQIKAGKTRILKKVREKRTIRQSSDKSDDILVDQVYEFELHDKLGALVEAGNILGLKKNVGDGADEFRGFFQTLRGGHA